MRILIVDDHASNRKLLRAQLEGEELTVVEAADGVEALLVLERETVDAVISDILMPNMDGYRFCQELRRSERHGNLPFILYTSTYTSSSDRALALAVSADKYLTKPATTEDLLAALREATEQSKRRKFTKTPELDTSFLMKQYTSSLVNKLEKKNIELNVTVEELERAHARISELNEGLEKRVAERTTELARAKGELQAVLDAATHFAIIATDSSGIITLFNAGAEQMLGYKAEEVVGISTPEIFHLESEVRAHGEELTAQLGRDLRGFDAMVEIASQGKFEEREWTYVRKDGGQFTVGLLVTALHASERKVGFLGVATDITERKKVQSELIRAKEAAESATGARSDFLANMSHEIRTPMNGVLGMTTLLLDSDLSEVQRHQAETISRSGESLLSLINDILDFSKIEAGKLEFELLDFDLNETVKDSLEMLAQGAEAKGLEFTSFIESNVRPLLRGDPSRLRQVLTNLVSNAIKFTEHGEVRVKISLESQTDAETRLRFEIKDSGIGIPAEVQSRLFQAFSQADTSTSRKYGGTGLGLAISRQLIGLMQGQFGIESAPGKGSTFWFTATMERQPEGTNGHSHLEAGLNTGMDRVVAASVGKPMKISPVADSFVPAKQKLRILIAEDNIVNKEVTQGLLQKLGYRADAVANGEEVLMALRSRCYDVVLMDCRMPLLDGFETTRRIRRFEQEREGPFDRETSLRIIAMTANSMKGDREKCLAAGMNDYVAKPVRLESLKAALARRAQSESRLSLAGMPHQDQHQTTETPVVCQEVPMVNLARLRDINDDDPARIRRLVEIYLGQAAPLLVELQLAIDASAPERVSEAAHKLVGSSISCGVQALTASLRKLEERGDAGDLTGAGALLDDARQIFLRVEKLLNKFLQEL
jgi:PAS domain S-box-containing protein